MYGSDGNLVVAVYDHQGRRAVLDGGFTRLYMNWDTAGTGQLRQERGELACESREPVGHRLVHWQEIVMTRPLCSVRNPSPRPPPRSGEGEKERNPSPRPLPEAERGRKKDSVFLPLSASGRGSGEGLWNRF